VSFSIGTLAPSVFSILERVGFPGGSVMVSCHRCWISHEGGSWGW